MKYCEKENYYIHMNNKNKNSNNYNMEKI